MTTTPEKSFFQAIGTIFGVITTGEKSNEYYVNIKNKGEILSFPLYLTRHSFRIFKRKQSQLFGKSLYLIVYPKLKFDIKARTQKLIFCLLAWSENNNKLPTDVNKFILRGVWQFIPQTKTPVISVNRNFKGKDEKKRLQDKGEKFPASHVPVLWRDANVKPFRFNKNKKLQCDRFFVEMVTRFIPDRKCFGFESLLSMPTTTLPSYIKPIKSP